MLPVDITTAKLADFRSPATCILFGDRLKEIKQIQASILAHGLLSPLIVMQRGKKMIVIDGKKRLAALLRMRFSGTLPRSLVNVPYSVVDQTPTKTIASMSLLSNREKFEEVLALRLKGQGLMEIATKLYISKQCVKDLLNVTRLSERLKQAYFGGNLSMEQARAFATLPNMDAQDNLLIALGPFAAAPDILTAIIQGETVLDIGDDNVLILPSKQTQTPIPLAA